MKKLLNFDEFVNENKTNFRESINEAKPSADFGFGAKNLSDLKPGDFVWREMERHNPQLGIYYTLNKAKIAKVSGKKIWLDEYGTPNPNFYDKETGEQLKTSGSAYGSVYYTLMTHQQALTAINADKDGKYKRDADKVKSFKSQDAADAVKESVNESTEVSVEKITTPAERKALKNAFENIVTGIDKLSFKKDGTIEGKRGYFYRHGITPEKTAKELTSALKSQGINITVIDYYDDFKPWPKDSNFVVVFKISGVNESVNEGAVKAFEIGIKNLINNIRAGYGWIDPEYVYDSVINSSDFEDMDWETIKDEVYQRLIDQNLLYYANDADPETKGKRVSKVGEIKESVNEAIDEFVPASLTNEFQDLKKGDIVKIKAIEYTKLGDRSMIECIRPDGKKMDIKKEFITVKI